MHRLLFVAILSTGCAPPAAGPAVPVSRPRCSIEAVRKAAEHLGVAQRAYDCARRCEAVDEKGQPAGCAWAVGSQGAQKDGLAEPCDRDTYEPRSAGGPSPVDLSSGHPGEPRLVDFDAAAPSLKVRATRQWEKALLHARESIRWCDGDQEGEGQGQGQALAAVAIAGQLSLDGPRRAEEGNGSVLAAEALCFAHAVLQVPRKWQTSEAGGPLLSRVGGVDEQVFKGDGEASRVEVFAAEGLVSVWDGRTRIERSSDGKHGVSICVPSKFFEVSVHSSVAGRGFEKVAFGGQRRERRLVFRTEQPERSWAFAALGVSGGLSVVGLGLAVASSEQAAEADRCREAKRFGMICSNEGALSAVADGLLGTSIGFVLAGFGAAGVGAFLLGQARPRQVRMPSGSEKMASGAVCAPHGGGLRCAW